MAGAAASGGGDLDAGAFSGCAAALEGGDYSTKAGREKANTDAARCSAEVVCAAYGIPPKLCGDVGAAIAGKVAEIWNSIFGNEDEWEEYYAARARSAATSTSLDLLQLADFLQDAATADAASSLIDLWRELVPSDPNALGGGARQEIVMRFNSAGQHAGYDVDDIPVTVYTANAPALYLLKSFGADLRKDNNGKLYPPDWIGEGMKVSLGNRVGFGQAVLKSGVPSYLDSLKVALMKSVDFVKQAATQREAKAAADEAARKRKTVTTVAVVSTVTIAGGVGLWQAWRAGLLQGMLR